VKNDFFENKLINEHIDYLSEKSRVEDEFNIKNVNKNMIVNTIHI
jgi:hypothetical protein